MLTAKRALAFLKNTAELDNSDVLEMARFSPRNQAGDAFQLVNLSTTRGGGSQNGTGTLGTTGQVVTTADQEAANGMTSFEKDSRVAANSNGQHAREIGGVVGQQIPSAQDQRQPAENDGGHRDWLYPQPDGSLQIKGPYYLRWKKPHELVNGVLGGIIAGGRIPGLITPAIAGTLIGKGLDEMDFRYPWLTYEPEQTQEPQNPDTKTPHNGGYPAPREVDPNEGLA